MYQYHCLNGEEAMSGIHGASCQAKFAFCNRKYNIIITSVHQGVVGLFQLISGYHFTEVSSLCLSYL